MKSLLSALRGPRLDLAGEYKNLRVALIADELTRSSLGCECQVQDVTPFNYRLLLKYWRPDLLFVESAWHGANNAWKFRIASYPDHPQRDNRILAQVVAYARELGIPCIFWNKEDGVHFKRFIASAALFDTIFTVDVNCVERYRQRLGEKPLVAPLLFAVQPRIHHPDAKGFKFSRACFMGSYSHHLHERRRQWQDMLFTASSAFGLTIFDRNSARKSPNYRYPPLPGREIRPSVSYEETAQIYRDYLVSLNVNTIEDSATMFSRRLIEIIACGGLAMTTPALSVENYFKDYCHVVATPAEAQELFQALQAGLRPKDREMTRAGAEYVLRHHTWAHRLETILHAVK